MSRAGRPVAGARGGTGRTADWLLRGPAEIEERARATVAAEARLDHLPAWLREAAVAMVLASGMVDLPNRLAWSDDLGRAVRGAVAGGATVRCDGPALAATVRASPAAATARVETGAAGAGEVALIGSDPLALAALLEAVRGGALRPAAVIALPVGLVNAAEAKAALAAAPMGLAFLTLRGRRGGAALAAAALTGLLEAGTD